MTDEVLGKVAGHQAWVPGTPSPIPAEAPDGQVPTTVDGAYALAAASVGAVQVVTRTLTSAEILALNTAPIDLVAGEAGKVYWPIGASMAYHYGTAPYATNLTLNIGNLSGSSLTLICDAALGFNSDVVVFFISNAASTAIFPADFLPGGAPLQLFNDTADPTGGDGTLDIIVAYRTIDVS